MVVTLGPISYLLVDYFFLWEGEGRGSLSPGGGVLGLVLFFTEKGQRGRVLRGGVVGWGHGGREPKFPSRQCTSVSDWNGPVGQCELLKSAFVTKLVVV